MAQRTVRSWRQSYGRVALCPRYIRSQIYFKTSGWENGWIQNDGRTETTKIKGFVQTVVVKIEKEGT